MKKLLLTLLLYLPLVVLAQGNYSFYSAPGFSEEIRDDVIHLLEKSTGGKWMKASRESQVQSGIILRLEHLPAFKVKESFRLQSNGSSLLTITSSSNEGLTFAIYRHLRNLGFKFYLPDDIYTIVPKNINPFGARKDIIDQPFAQIREFAGTGGFGSTNPDADKSVEKDWNLWRARNGFGSAYHLSGHRGDEFILSNKKILQQNPGWLVTPLSGDDYMDTDIKLNYFNKQAVDFYTSWTIASLASKDHKLLPPNFTELVSIEPSDGGGFLTKSPAGKTVSASDQVYGAANLAAEKLDKLFPNHPNIGVNLYAYSSHAAPPSFPLHPRVFVQLVPYQYQNVAFGPSFIKMWAEKVKRFGIYDYFKYADEQWDLPGGRTLEEAMMRLVHSIQNGSEGTSYETSYSKFSTGIPLWIFGRYLADGDADWKKNLQSVSKDLYPSAPGAMNKLFDLFYSEANFSVNHLSNASSYVDEASRLSKDPVVQQRLDELKQYLYYIHLVYRARNVANGTLDERMIPVSEYAWKIYESKIIHSYRIMGLVSYTFLNFKKTDPEYNRFYSLHQKWYPETERTKTDWFKRPQGLKPATVTANFNTLLQLYNKQLVNASYKIPEAMQAIRKSYQPVKQMIVGGNYSLRGSFGIYAEKKIQVKIRYKLSGTTNTRLTISGIDNSYTQDISHVLTKPEGEISLSLPAGETRLFMMAENGTAYRLQVNISDGVIFFNGSPRGILAFYKNFNDELHSYTYDPSVYPSYFYMPENISTLDYKTQLNHLQLSAGGRTFPSKLVQTENAGFETRQLSVPPQETGKIWKAAISNNFNYSLMNVPDRYFLLRE